MVQVVEAPSPGRVDPLRGPEPGPVFADRDRPFAFLDLAVVNRTQQDAVRRFGQLGHDVMGLGPGDRSIAAVAQLRGKVFR